MFAHAENNRWNLVNMSHIVISLHIVQELQYRLEDYKCEEVEALKGNEVSVKNWKHLKFQFQD